MCKNIERQDEDLDFILSLTNDELTDFVTNIYNEYILYDSIYNNKRGDNDGREQQSNTKQSASTRCI